MRRLLFVLLLSLSAFAAPTVHQAALNWTQSNSSGVTANCVYRTQTSGTGYQQIFCSTAPVTTYTDQTVQGGQTYYYVVTAVAGAEESAYSSEVQAVIPQSPSQVTGLSVSTQ